MKQLIYASLLIIGSLVIAGCAGDNSESKKTVTVFAGEPDAVAKADAMFEAIGGKEKWANIQSLYWKAIHSEGESSYENATWREFDEFNLKVEQKDDTFHRVGYFSSAGGWIEYLDRDTVERVNDAMMANIYRNHQKNIYSVLHFLATEPHLVAKFGRDGRLEFEQNLVVICAFVLNSENRPVQFITRSIDGLRAETSVFDQWGESNGYFYPASGGTPDSTFWFQVEEWQADNKPFSDISFVYESENTTGE